VPYSTSIPENQATGVPQGDVAQIIIGAPRLLGIVVVVV
jgi:hypothetical protein